MGSNNNLLGKNHKLKHLYMFYKKQHIIYIGLNLDKILTNNLNMKKHYMLNNYLGIIHI